MNQYLRKIDNLLETHPPCKRLNKLLTNPWIAQGLLNSVKKQYISLTSWGGASLALVGHPSGDGIMIKIPYR